MKLLVDENLSPRLVAAISDLYPGSRHVEDCGLISASDDDIWALARAHPFAILTKDSDFSDHGQLEDNPPKVIWLRIGNCSTTRAEFVLRNARERIPRFLSAESENCLVISVRATRKGGA